MPKIRREAGIQLKCSWNHRRVDVLSDLLCFRYFVVDAIDTITVTIIIQNNKNVIGNAFNLPKWMLQTKIEHAE